MGQCPITYEFCSPEKYSLHGLKRLNKGLSTLEPFDSTCIPDTCDSWIDPVVWPFACAMGRVNARLQRMESVEKNGRYLLFPPSRTYWQIPQNVDLSFRLAQRFGLSIPFHGLMHDKDGTLTCFLDTNIWKANRVEPTHPIQDQSLEALVATIDEVCTFPILEKYKLLQRILFTWLIGFETQQVSCFFFHQVAQKVELSPAFLFFNSTLPFGVSNREMGLSMNGKTTGFCGTDFVDYAGKYLLGLSEESIQFLVSGFQKTYTSCRELVLQSFLSEELKEQYLDVLVGRLSRLNY